MSKVWSPQLLRPSEAGSSRQSQARPRTGFARRSRRRGGYPCASDWTTSRSRMAASSSASPCGQLLRRRCCSDRRRVPSDYAVDGVRYILRAPSGVARGDPSLRIRWTLEDRDARAVLVDSDGPAHGRLSFDFVPGSFAASDFGVVAGVYRPLGLAVTELGTQSVNVHMRSSLPPGAYVRWRWQGSNPQLRVVEATD